MKKFEVDMNSETKCDQETMKCPNPKCGIELKSPYHTICPVCAEPFPIEMLFQEPKKMNYKYLIFATIIIAIGLIILEIAL